MIMPIELTEQPLRLARAIDKRGLNEPVVLFLVAARPIRYMLSQLLVIATPLLGWSNDLQSSRFGWLEDDEQYDLLLALLEEPTRIIHSEADR
jgi:hypothetical protein